MSPQSAQSMTESDTTGSDKVAFSVIAGDPVETAAHLNSQFVTSQLSEAAESENWLEKYLANCRLSMIQLAVQILEGNSFQASEPSSVGSGEKESVESKVVLKLGPEDVVVGILCWMLLLSLSRTSPLLGSAVHVLQTPAALLSDLANSIHALFGAGLAAALHFIFFVLPTMGYMARRVLHATIGLPLDVLPVNFQTGEGLGVHLLLAFGVLTWLFVSVSGAQLWVQYYYRWRLDNTVVTY